MFPHQGCLLCVCHAPPPWHASPLRGAQPSLHPRPGPPACRLLAYSGFPYPIALTMWHMTFCSVVGFICIRVLGLVKSHNLSARDYMQRVMPIGVLYAASLWLSNSAYLYLSVSFIQMTKSLMPGLVYASGILLGTEQYQVRGRRCRCCRAFRPARQGRHSRAAGRTLRGGGRHPPAQPPRSSLRQPRQLAHRVTRLPARLLRAPVGCSVRRRPTCC